MDASCKIQRSIHDVRLTYKYVSRILGTYQNMSALRRLFFFCCRSVELGSVHKRHYFFSSEESKLPKLVTPHRIKPTISSYLNQSSILAFDGLSSQ